MMRKGQAGITTVEFAIVALLVFTMVFGVIEIGRGYYIYTLLDDVARRGARLAAVCPVNDPAIPQMAIYNRRESAGSGADAGPRRGRLSRHQRWGRHNADRSRRIHADSIRACQGRRLRTYVGGATRCERHHDHNAAIRNHPASRKSRRTQRRRDHPMLILGESECAN